MAPLQGAFAFEQVYGVAVAVGEDLDFDVVWSLDQSFDIEHAVAKCGPRFSTRGLNRLVDVAHVADPPHPFSAAAC